MLNCTMLCFHILKKRGRSPECERATIAVEFIGRVVVPLSDPQPWLAWTPRARFFELKGILERRYPDLHHVRDKQKPSLLEQHQHISPEVCCWVEDADWGTSTGDTSVPSPPTATSASTDRTRLGTLTGGVLHLSSKGCVGGGGGGWVGGVMDGPVSFLS